METLKHLTGMDILHIPFQGQAPAMTALIGGQIDLEMLAAGQAQTSLQSGRLKVLAVTTQERVVGMPDVPTFKEAGVPSLSFSNWYGLVAPAGLPPPILQRLATEMAAVMKSADMKAALKNLGLKDIDPPMPPSEFKQFLASEMIRWGSVIRSADIKLE
jgi:tripartite-type tricarboxylate transporter receptor subunit TctC